MHSALNNFKNQRLIRFENYLNTKKVTLFNHILLPVYIKNHLFRQSLNKWFLVYSTSTIQPAGASISPN